MWVERKKENNTVQHRTILEYLTQTNSVLKRFKIGINYMKDEMKLKPCLDGNSNQMKESFKFDLERTGDKYAWRIKR